MAKQDEVERRLPVWHALSELFLDTELQPGDYRRIAARLAESGFSTAELRAILHDEVTPAFAVNLMSVAGEWTPWSEADVREIMARDARSLRPMRWLRKRRFKTYAEAEWRKLLPLIGAQE